MAVTHTPGTLFLVSTPIGNLADLTPRAVTTLQSVSLILAEDTRHSRTLLDHAGIRTPMTSYHEHNEARSSDRLLERLRAGEDLALISDAGTPLISDPGARLVRSAIDAGIRVVAVPGASALLAGLVASGLPAERFTFLGFLPRRGSDRAAALRDVQRSPHTVVVYEAPGRVAATLADLCEAGAGARPVVVARELTKQFEEVRRGTVEEMARYYEEAPPRGEVVLVIGGAPDQPIDEPTLRDQAVALGREGLSPREVMRVLMEQHRAPRNLAYRLAHERPDEALPVARQRRRTEEC
jgi:16S rRNA (cytidine1402-2'-O)-methyltransferase